jgi:hypothetical protein
MMQKVPFPSVPFSVIRFIRLTFRSTYVEVSAHSMFHFAEINRWILSHTINLSFPCDDVSLFAPLPFKQMPN